MTHRPHGPRVLTPWYSVRDRLCYLCQRPIAEGDGVAYLDLGILVHVRACGVIVDGERRIYDRSPRGRARPRREVLARLRTYRPPPAWAVNLLRELDALEQRS